VIISTKIYTNFANPGITKPVVIYGWHYPSGSPIQPLYNGHGETYADYSHGIRLVQNSMIVDGASAIITNILTDSALAPLLSDEGAMEGTSGGVITEPEYTVPPAPAAILVQPGSRRTFVGGDVVFQAVATGDPAPGYRWLFNGTGIAGASNSTLIISNVQPTNAGNYSVTVTNSAGNATSRSAWLRVTTNAYPVIFADNFDINTFTNWNFFWGADNGIPDYTTDWSYNYSLTPFSFNGTTSLITPAPNSLEGTTRGMKFTVNNNDTNAATAGVNIYPKNQSFAGNFALKFDLWINYPGGSAGINSTGSTEHAISGINHSGTQVNWAATTASSSDGIWFGVDGEGGTSRDYRAYLGNIAGTEIELTGVAASGLAESNNAAAIYQSLFPASRFETPGSPGKNWVEVELRQTNNFVSWILDGTLVAQRTNMSAFRSGSIMLGFMDTFVSIANPASDAFVIFDNVRVEELTNRLRFLSASVSQGQQVALTWSAVAGQDYTLETSTNLVQWQTLFSARASNAPLSFADFEAATIRQRFYRVREGVP
jgi:Ig-like domain-containing protein